LAIHRSAGEHGFEIAEAPQTAEELASRPADDRPVLLMEDQSVLYMSAL
jgi:hypothetical protein